MLMKANMEAMKEMMALVKKIPTTKIRTKATVKNQKQKEIKPVKKIKKDTKRQQSVNIAVENNQARKKNNAGNLKQMQPPVH